MARMSIDGYGQLELNRVAFRRYGANEAQCKLDDTQFNASAPAENGMLLAVDKVNGKIKLPDLTSTGKKLPIALNYTTEHMYDERENALKDFALVPGSFLPRLGYLTVGDLFTTNCVDLGSYTDFASVKAALSTTTIYGGACANGAIALSTVAPTYGPVLQVVKCYTMPDGQNGIKFQCNKAF